MVLIVQTHFLLYKMEPGKNRVGSKREREREKEREREREEQIKRVIDRA
jgi:hypothetical protein